MGVELIVFSPARIQMLNKVHSAGPVSSFEVPLGERSKKELGLVEPGGVRRGLQHADLRIVLEERVGVAGDVAGASVPYQVNAPRMAVSYEELLESGPQVSTVVGVEAPAPHLARMDDESHQEVDSAVPDVLELASFDLARVHQAGRLRAFQRLDVGFLVHADDYIPPLDQSVDTLVAPQNGCGLVPEFLVEPVGVFQYRER